jgi:AcrR family transcriptional regulator
MSDKIHHGNLKETLMKVAIAMIDEKGFDALSVRKLSLRCHVSHNALYRHFKSKDDLVDQSRRYVSGEMAASLSKAIAGLDYSEVRTLGVLGRAYIQFFLGNPSYFRFIYDSRSSCVIFLTLDQVKGNYPPFEIFRQVCVAIIEKVHYPREAGLKKLIRAWALVQGGVSLAISPNVRFEGKWEESLEGFFE